MNTREIELAIQARFAAPQYSVIFQVRNGTGFEIKPRTADAIVMSLWPSRGLELMGVEIKVSRTDWLKELKNPAKAEDILQFCDRWYIAAGDKNIIQPGELPPTWGLLLPRGTQMVIVTEAPKLKPGPIDRLFLAAVLRAASNPRRLSAETNRLIDEARQEERHRADVHAKHCLQEAAILKQSICEFEEKSGIRISQWDAGKIGEIVSVLRRNGLAGLRDEVRRLHEYIGRIAAEVEKCQMP